MFLKRRTIIIVSLVVAGAGAYYWHSEYLYANYPIVNARPQGSAIIAFGDSLTYGWGADKGRDYPSILSKQLGMEILNKGKPGDTSEEALARIEADVLNLDPKIVIVLLGGNDYLRRYSVESVIENLDRIITRIQRKGALVILVGMKSPLGQHEGKFRELARRKGCPYVGHILKDILWDKSKKSDDIHPNNEGYEIMAGRIGAVLRKYL